MTDIPESAKTLVHDLLEAGCDMMTVGDGYVINEPEDQLGQLRVHQILESYGPRAHLVSEIADYLRSLGRYVDL